MNDVDLERTLAPRVMTMRIIVFALVSGVLMFIGVAIFMRASGQAVPPPDTPLLTYLAFVFASMMIAAALVVPRLIESAAIKRIAKTRTPGDTGPLLGIYQTCLIVRSALFEGPAFFALIAYILEGQWPTLVIAGVLAFGIASGFPSVTGVQAWLEDRRERIAAES